MPSKYLVLRNRPPPSPASLKSLKLWNLQPVLQECAGRARGEPELRNNNIFVCCYLKFGVRFEGQQGCVYVRVCGVSFRECVFSKVLHLRNTAGVSSGIQ